MPPMLFCLLPDCLVRWYNLFLKLVKPYFQLFFRKMPKIFQGFQCLHILLLHLYVPPVFVSALFHGAVNGRTLSVYRLPVQNSAYDCTIDRNNTQIQICSHTESMKKNVPRHILFQTHLIKFHFTYPYKTYDLRKRNHLILTQPLSTSTHTHHTPSAGKSRQSLVLLFSADKTPHPVNTLLY